MPLGYKIISVDRRSCPKSIGSQLNVSVAAGANLEVRFTRPLLGAEAVVTTEAPLLPQIAVTVVTALSDCSDICCGVPEAVELQAALFIGGYLIIVVTDGVNVAVELSLLPCRVPFWCRNSDPTNSVKM